MNRKSGGLPTVYCRDLPILYSLLLKKFSSILPHKCRTLKVCSSLLHNIIFNLIIFLYLTARIRKIYSIPMQMSVLSYAASYTIFMSIRQSKFKWCAEHTRVLQRTAAYRGKGCFVGIHLYLYMHIYTQAAML